MDDRHVEDHRSRPTPDRPLHGERRPVLKPLAAVLALVVAIALVFAVITWLRYST